MLSTESGVIPGSDYYIYTPSTQAESLFLYPINVGYFRYRPGYCLRRDSYDSFLIMYMRKGGCEIEINGRHYHAAADQVVVLDCYGPHCYHTSTGWDAEWLHFDGPGARGYFDAIVENGNPVITLKDHYRFEKYLHKIYMQFKDRAPVKEAILNNYIVNILTELLIGRNSEHPVSISSSIIEDTVAFINEHLTDPLTLEDLAAEVSLSPFYFSRLFKRETGFSPHEYVITARVNTAKFLLKSSDSSIKDICFSTGFASESSFCTTFKKITKTTPSEYRISARR